MILPIRWQDSAESLGIETSSCLSMTVSSLDKFVMELAVLKRTKVAKSDVWTLPISY